MNLKECFADKLMNAGDTVGATLARAGFTIKKNKKRGDCLTEAAKETDSVRLFAAAQVFSE